MKKKKTKKEQIVEKTGHAAFWVSWPLLYSFLYLTKRTRILVVHGDDVLVLKGWLGSGRWVLPGGGLHRKEDVLEGAVRELKEETGVVADTKQFKFLFSRRSRSEQGLRYTMHAYLLSFDKKPRLDLSANRDILEAKWVPWQKLRDDPETSQNIKDMIRAWQQAAGVELKPPKV